jgi:hypothetical protein
MQSSTAHHLQHAVTADTTFLLPVVFFWLPWILATARQSPPLGTRQSLQSLPVPVAYLCFEIESGSFLLLLNQQPLQLHWIKCFYMNNWLYTSAIFVLSF